MKKTKQFLLLLTTLLIVFTTFNSCKQEELIEIESNSILENYSQSYKEFLTTTQLKELNDFKHILYKDIRNKSRILEFKIDKNIVLKRKYSYSFQVIPTNFLDTEKTIYNLVYFKKNDKWEHIIVEYKIEKQFTSKHNIKKEFTQLKNIRVIYYSELNGGYISESNDLKSYRSNGGWNIVEFYHCTGCQGSCDMCDKCYTEKWVYVAEFGGGDSGGPGDNDGWYYNQSSGGSNYNSGSNAGAVTMCDETNSDNTILNLYSNNKLWADSNIQLFNELANTICSNNSQGNSQFIQWAINYLQTNTNLEIQKEELINKLQDEYFIIRSSLNFKNNTKLNCVYKKVTSSSNFNQYLKNFDGKFSTAHLKFDASSNMNSLDNAMTSPPNGYWITITINTNNLNRPTLDIARTFMHEMIHAEIFRILLSLAPTSNGQIDLNLLNTMLNDHDFPGIYDYYRRFGVNNMQHEQMALHYRGIIENFLKQIDNTLTSEQYEAIAWEGLRGTIAWNNLSTQKKQSIKNIYNSFLTTGIQNCP